MDTKRVMEIISSREPIGVTYHGSPVWIQGINGDIARVRFTGSDDQGEVPVHELSEDINRQSGADRDIKKSDRHNNILGPGV